MMFAFDILGGWLTLGTAAFAAIGAIAALWMKKSRTPNERDIASIREQNEKAHEEISKHFK